MTAEGMIERLQTLIAHGLNPKAIVKAWDGDSEQYQPVSGLLYHNQTIELQTDDIG